MTLNGMSNRRIFLHQDVNKMCLLRQKSRRQKNDDSDKDSQIKENEADQGKGQANEEIASGGEQISKQSEEKVSGKDGQKVTPPEGMDPVVQSWSFLREGAQTKEYGIRNTTSNRSLE